MDKISDMAKRPRTTMAEVEGLRADRQAAFVREYVKDWNGAAAARRAGYAEGSAAEVAYELLMKSNIRAAVERRQSEIAALAEVDAAMVVKDLYDIATADARELVSIYLDCCRHCYGIGGERQWTRGEYAAALEVATAKGKPAPPMAGGMAAVATAAISTLSNEELEAHLLSRGVPLPQPALEVTTNEQ